jgi:two-component system, chemotaxis family, protein-glutamate methylesterase/glutaminase
MRREPFAPKIRVLIVEDSASVRMFLHDIIERDPRLEVAAAVETAEEALRIVDQVAPHVISLDIRLPGMNGLEATRRIMSLRPTPIVIVAASVQSDDLNIVMKALEAGALTVLEKQVGRTNQDYQDMAERLCTQLAIMSQVKVVRQHSTRITSTRPSHSPAVCSFAMLGVASSTGGPAALLQLLGSLGSSFPLPILLVQHITASFLEGFAAWLQTAAGLPVVIVRHTATPLPGVVYMAPADRHLIADGGQLRVESGSPVSGQCPSGTVLFRSMAQSFGNTGLGVVLTGMGDDGAAGLRELRDAGGHTIAENASTAVVYGMPAAAVKLGAVCESLPLPAIGVRLRELVALNHNVSCFLSAQAI